MKRFSFLGAILFVTGLIALSSCSQDEEGSAKDDWGSVGLTLTREQSKQDAMNVIETFERNGIKLHLIDITERFVEARYNGQSVPVKHVELTTLPTEIQAIVRGWGTSALTKVFRMEYQGETYYEISCPLQNTAFNIYNEKGEQYGYNDDFQNAFKGACCILVLDTEKVISSKGAPNYLLGIWQNDWQHIKHTDGDAYISLYPDFPFSITEVKRFNEDGTGYLRTIKTYKDGSNEVALDPFRYELTDYYGGEKYGYHGYGYKCYFEAGDVIEYQERSYDSFQSLEWVRGVACFPWFKQTRDQFESLEVNAGQKYGIPRKDDKSPIVGRWTGGEYSESMMKPISMTWVFRSDNTGYCLLEENYLMPFAFSVSYNDSNAEVVIYKYNTGFTIDEGFAKSLIDLSFDPTILPKGEVINAKFNGNSLELESWGNFKRQE